VTLQPVRRYGVDAAILFQDIMTPLPQMGVDIEFKPGPVIAEPIRSRGQVDALRIPEVDELTPFVADAIRLIRAATATPLIGFGGAPLTLATYLIQGSGSKDYAQFRGFLRAEPEASHALLEKLTEVSIRYLTMQVQAGAQAIQLFDSWAGLHDPATYAEFARPYNVRVFEALGALGVPRIYLAVNSLHLFDVIAGMPMDAISVDWRQPLSMVRDRIPGVVVQGNLDPAWLLGDRDRLLTEVDRILADGLGGPHVFNLGHGMMREIDPAQVQATVDRIRSFDRSAR
jgi:uroporphyrinogen decarboxylase